MRVGGHRPWTAVAGAAGLLLGAAGLLAAVDPADGPTICPFRAVTGLDCPGCGMTRAAHQLLRGHFVTALDLNLLSIAVVPLVTWVAFTALVAGLGGPRLRGPVVSRSVQWVAAAIVVLFWVARNLPFPAVHWMNSGA